MGENYSPTFPISRRPVLLSRFGKGESRLLNFKFLNSGPSRETTGGNNSFPPAARKQRSWTERTWPRTFGAREGRICGQNLLMQRTLLIFFFSLTLRVEEKPSTEQLFENFCEEKPFGTSQKRGIPMARSELRPSWKYFSASGNLSSASY